MKIPRDISSDVLIKNLQKMRYNIIRTKGSHIRLDYEEKDKRHRITIPAHNPIKIGTLNSILNELSNFFKISKEELLNKFFN